MKPQHTHTHTHTHDTQRFAHAPHPSPTQDYGNPDSADDFAYILPYSPLHNVRPPAGSSGQYPAMMLATGDHDDRWVGAWVVK